ncbi:MAG: WD40 repeat domain-containing protein [Bacteroidetes bacterium]|nr:WD40 repeat domain-containing protein [Bacteroidota bacterium]
MNLFYHKLLSGYFEEKPLYLDEPTQKKPNTRKLVEQPWQQTKGGDWDNLEKNTLCCFPFIMAKVKRDLTEDLLEDYYKALLAIPVEKKETLLWETFLQERIHILRRGNLTWPAYKILFQLAIEYADESPVTINAEKYLDDDRVDWIWIKNPQRAKKVYVDSCTPVLEGHLNEVQGAFETGNGFIVSWAGGVFTKDKTLRIWNSQSGACLKILKNEDYRFDHVLELSNGKILTWGGRYDEQDKTEALQIWDLQSEESQYIMENQAFRIEGVKELNEFTILSSGGQGTMKIWDNHTGACLLTLTGHVMWNQGATQLKDGSILSCGDGTIRIWDKFNGVCLSILEEFMSSNILARQLNDGRILCLGSNYIRQIYSLRIWNPKDGTCLNLSNGNSTMQKDFLELSDCRVLAWSFDNSLRIFETLNGTCTTFLEGHTEYVSGANQLSNGNIISWSVDRSIRIWDVKNGSCIFVLEGHTAVIKKVLILKDGKILSWDDKTLRIWDIDDGKCISILEGYWMRDFLELTDGRILFWGYDKTLRIWNRHQGVVLSDFLGKKDNDAFELSDGRILTWSENGDGQLRIWDKFDGNCLLILKGHTESVTGVAELSNGSILSWANDFTLRIWDRQNGSCLHVLKGYPERIESAFEITNYRLLTWSGNSLAFCIWDLHAGKPLFILKGHTALLKGAIELVDGKILTWSIDRTLRIWDKQNGSCLWVLQGHQNEIRFAIELTTGGILSWAGLTTSTDKSLRLWDISSKTCLRKLDGHDENVSGALELSDGRLLSWSQDHTLRIWDPQSGDCLVVLKGHSKGIVESMELTDERIISWSADNTGRIWDAQSGVCLLILEGIKGFVTNAIELPNHKLVSFGIDNTLRVWDIQTGACVQFFEGINFCRFDSNSFTALGVGGLAPNIFLLNQNVKNTRQIYWHSDSEAKVKFLYEDGTLVINTDSGQACFLKLYCGKDRISLTELKEKLEIRTYDKTFFSSNNYGNLLQQANAAICNEENEKAIKLLFKARYLKRFRNDLDAIWLIRKVKGIKDTFEEANKKPNNNYVPEKIKSLLIENRIDDALKILSAISGKDDSLTNTVGVCHLRLGNYAEALMNFDKIVRKGFKFWKENTKLVYKRNYLTTLLLLDFNLENYFSGSFNPSNKSEILDEGMQKIIKCYTSWKNDEKIERKKQTFFKRMFGIRDRTISPAVFDFPLGELDF